jgi:precorrin-2 dehydrogenase/sirohydrochlorin ferrochelatase
MGHLAGVFERPLVRYYPVNLDVRDRDCLVVGGGPVSERKVQTLLECGARITVVAQTATSGLKALASGGRVVLSLRRYQSSDLDGKFLVIGATDDEEVNKRISQDASSRSILCNIADRPEACTFVLPALVRRGDLLIAVSTSNRSPAVAKHVRQTLEREFGPEYAVLLDLMGAVRSKFMEEGKSPEAHKGLFQRLLDEGLLLMIREGRIREVDILLNWVLGKGYTWHRLLKDRKY